MISREEIINLSKLSKLSLAPEEVSKLETDLNNILNYVSELKTAEFYRGDTSGILTDSNLPHNVMREDGEPHTAGEFSADLIKAFPESQDGRLKVKKIL